MLAKFASTVVKSPSLMPCLPKHRAHRGVARRADHVGGDAAALYVFNRMDRSIRKDDEVFAEIAGLAVLDHICDKPLIEMGVGDREGERTRREGGHLEVTDRLGLNLRCRAVEAQRLQDIALAEMLEHRRLAFAERLDQRRHVPGSDDPADAYRQRLGPSNRDQADRSEQRHSPCRHPPSCAHFRRVPLRAQVYDGAVRAWVAYSASPSERKRRWVAHCRPENRHNGMRICRFFRILVAEVS